MSQTARCRNYLDTTSFIHWKLVITVSQEFATDGLLNPNFSHHLKGSLYFSEERLSSSGGPCWFVQLRKPGEPRSSFSSSLFPVFRLCFHLRYQGIPISFFPHHYGFLRSFSCLPILSRALNLTLALHSHFTSTSLLQAGRRATGCLIQIPALSPLSPVTSQPCDRSGYLH